VMGESVRDKVCVGSNRGNMMKGMGVQMGF
jgi:hypothetical protein